MIGQTYVYKDKSYVLISTGKMRLPSEVWIDSVTLKESNHNAHITVPKGYFNFKFHPISDAIKTT